LNPGRAKIMNAFDLSILHFINGFANRSPTFDSWVVFAMLDPLLDGGVFVALFWWAWGQHGKTDSEKRETLLFGLVACLFAVVAARVLAIGLPYRERPLHNPLVHFTIPSALDPQILIHWSSFPSDHATIAFCMAAILWRVSKPLGVVAAIHALVVVSMTRIYCGVHYPTDVIAGALLGTGIAYLSMLPGLKAAVVHPISNWVNKHAASFYAFVFLWTFEMADMFDSVRGFVSKLAIVKLVRTMAHPNAGLFIPMVHGLSARVLSIIMWHRIF